MESQARFVRNVKQKKRGLCGRSRQLLLK